MKQIKIDDENGRGHETTLWRWIEKLEKARRISRVSDRIHVDVGILIFIRFGKD